MIKNYPIHIEPGKGRYVFIFVLNERAVLTSRLNNVKAAIMSLRILLL